MDNVKFDEKLEKIKNAAEQVSYYEKMNEFILKMKDCNPSGIRIQVETKENISKEICIKGHYLSDIACEGIETAFTKHMVNIENKLSEL